MTTQRARMQVMTLTDAAAARVREIVANASEPAAAIRVGLPRRCRHELQIEFANEAKPGDESSGQGARVCHPGAVLLARHAEDYTVDRCPRIRFQQSESDFTAAAASLFDHPAAK